MNVRVRGVLALACLALLLSLPREARTRATQSPPRTPARPASASVIDIDRRLDINRLSLVVTNVGSLGFDMGAGDAGLWYPRGGSTTLLFASGLWLGAFVNGETRVTVAEYSHEYSSGPMVGGGPGDPNDPLNRVWKVRRWTGDPADSMHITRAPGDRSVDTLVHHSWSEYMAGAAPMGAPWRLHRLPNTPTPDPADSVDVPGPDVLGDMMTWCLFNDADPVRHTSDAGGSPPLGAEVEQIVFGFDDPGPMGDAAFIRWRVRNRGTSTWMAFRAGCWSDPDLGGSPTYLHDKAGSDSARSVVFAYNGNPLDWIYAPPPPVLGTVLLGSSPAPAQGMRTGMHAATTYINGTDPQTRLESYNSLSGLNANGSVMFDPLGTATRYQYAGDPVLGSGWLDPLPSDKRMMATFAPRDISPGDSAELWVALLVAPEPGVLGGLSGLTCRTDYVQAVYASGFARPFPSAPDCSSFRNCPRPASYWVDQCAGSGGYTAARLDSLALMVDQRSAGLSYGGSQAGFCAVLGGVADERQLALREFATLLANVTATHSGLQPTGEGAVVLSPQTPFSCSWIPAFNIAELSATAAESRLTLGFYRNLVTTNRRALEGVDFGLTGFDGGVGTGFDFFGSTLDPSSQPDSFPRVVRVTFDHAQTQKAYRYLRYEQLDGSPPAPGRMYTYAGFVNVPFTVRDSATGEQLEAAFVERVVADADGTIKPNAFQPATFDSTWGPTDDPLGDREHLFIIRRPYTTVPRAEFARDGAIIDASMPVLFVLTAKLRDAFDVIDDGDAFDFIFGYPFTTGVDAILRDLAGQPLSDPAVAAQYQQIADCLGAINRAESVGPFCDEPTPALVSLASAQAEPGLVRIEWLVGMTGSVTVERREGVGAWQELVTALPDGNGRVTIEDRDVQAGERYGYRLRLATGFAGEVTLDVPTLHRLSLAGFRPNPAIGPLSVAFTLSSSEPARLEVLDVAGRRVFTRAIDRPVAGQRVLPLAGVHLAPGVYVLRLEQGSDRFVARGVVLR